MLKQLGKRPNIATGCKNLTDDSHGWTKHLIISEEVSDHKNLEVCFSFVNTCPFRIGKNLQHFISYQDEELEKK